MKYYICAICPCFARLPDTEVFKCRFCGSEKARELTFKEFMGREK